MPSSNQIISRRKTQGALNAAMISDGTASVSMAAQANQHFAYNCRDRFRRWFYETNAATYFDTFQMLLSVLAV